MLFLLALSNAIAHVLCSYEELLPRKESLIGIWQLDSSTNLRGVDGNGTKLIPSSIRGDPKLVFPCRNFFMGCYSVESPGPLARFDNLRKPASFTVGFWFNSSIIGPRFTGIIRIGDLFSVTYDSTIHKIKLFGFTGVDWKELVVVSGYLSQAWYYMAFSYNTADGESKVVYRDLYSGLKERTSWDFDPFFPIDDQNQSTTFLEIGSGITADTNRWIGMTERDQLACVTFYSNVLNISEIGILWKQCGVLEPNRYAEGDGNCFISPKFLIENRNTSIFADALDRFKTSGFPPFKSYSSDSLVAEMKLCLSSFGAGHYTPATEGNSALKIGFTFDIQSLYEISNTDETISVTATVIMVWYVNTCQRPQNHSVTDPDSEQLIPATTEDKKKIWQPTLRFITSANSDIYMTKAACGDELSISRHLFYLNENQSYEFQWMREGSFIAGCSLELARFPFDSQVCSFDFTITRGVNYALFDKNTTEFTMAENAFDYTEWKLISWTHSIGTVKFAMTNVSSASFSVTVKRIPDFFIQNLFAPTFVLGILVLGTFLMVPSEVSRPGFTVTVVLAFTVTQSDVLTQIPKVPQHNLLSNYVQNMEWFSAALTIYVLAMLPLSEAISTSKLHPKLARILDIVAFVIALATFVTINYLFLKNMF